MLRHLWTFINVLLISALYIELLVILKPAIFAYRFQPSLAVKYLHSQDIPHEVSDRVFLSDSDIHIAASYLYSRGSDPTTYNFQHPALLKYLYGLSIQAFQTPFVAHVAFGVLLLASTYILAFSTLKSQVGAIVASSLLVTDPLFIDISSQILLDVGQAATIIMYACIILYKPHKTIWLGVLAGLIAATKFWTGSLVIIFILNIYGLYTKRLQIKTIFQQFCIATLAFSATYLPSFIQQAGRFNIVVFELKTLKYWLNHSVTTIPGASLWLFITGRQLTWWGNQQTVTSSSYSILWPIGLAMSGYVSLKSAIIHLKKRTPISKLAIIAAIPIFYLFYLSIQAPFPRYFIVILPFLYIGMASQIVHRSSLKT